MSIDNTITQGLILGSLGSFLLAASFIVAEKRYDDGASIADMFSIAADALPLIPTPESSAHIATRNQCAYLMGMDDWERAQKIIKADLSKEYVAGWCRAIKNRNYFTTSPQEASDQFRLKHSPF